MVAFVQAVLSVHSGLVNVKLVITGGSAGEPLSSRTGRVSNGSISEPSLAWANHCMYIQARGVVLDPSAGHHEAQPLSRPRYVQRPPVDTDRISALRSSTVCRSVSSLTRAVATPVSCEHAADGTPPAR